MKVLLILSSLLLSLQSSASSADCYKFRGDENGLDVCVNDLVMLMTGNEAHVLSGPFRVLGFQEEVAIIKYAQQNNFHSPNQQGFVTRAIPELDLFIMEKRTANAKGVRVGDTVIRTANSSSASGEYQVIGLGSYNSIAVTIGGTFALWLHEAQYIVKK